MSEKEYKIFFSKIIDINDLSMFLAEEDWEYLSKFNNKIVKSRSATARYLIRKYLQENFPDNYAEFRIDLESGNKPFFENTDTLHFSISHSAEIVTVLFSKSKCGVDIEIIKSYRKDIAEKFFHKKEFEYLESITDTKNQSEEFYRIWTVKEAFQKLNGEGIFGGLSSFYVDEKWQIINKYDIIEDVTIISEKKLFDNNLYYCTSIIT
ncbi:MAG: 4'-phosphopantetheinyl transferase superfamily protein [Bacteroidales bacterium]|jgi:4'-phosphopantetheinyl transferase|nr:4'-phosphopantetheinyl transferase superfamily protein [Bacteroidales bacterium]